MTDDSSVESGSQEKPTPPEAEVRNLYRHWLTALGGALMLAGFTVFVILTIVDLASDTENPYRAIVGFIGAPIIGIVGLLLFLLSIWVQVRQAHRRGDVVRWRFAIEPSNPRYMRSFWRFLGFTGVFVLVFAFAGFRGYETTDSSEFCGSSCHVMEPVRVAYEHSPHARVPCVECHIGPGAGFWVQAKVDGIRQVVAVATDSFPRPIPTPIEDLRPAQETCETCHWPEQFYGERLVTRSYYRTDEGNTPWTVALLMKIGGGNPLTGALEGIHWHMSTDNIVEYIAIDDERNEIPWFRATNASGAIRIYADPEAEYPDPEDPDTEIRTFDCIDCHNRPSHDFAPPAISMNLALSTGRISKDLPFIRKLGVDLLNAEYESTAQAVVGISGGIDRFYLENYSTEFGALVDDIEIAKAELISIYKSSFFPEMSTDYRSRSTNLSHFVSAGCHRCHGNDQVTSTGANLSADCDSCHLIVAQGPTDDLGDVVSDVAGLEFEHPVQIGEAWKAVPCAQCHTRASGY
jgi:hypothetical protein